MKTLLKFAIVLIGISAQAEEKAQETAIPKTKNLDSASSKISEPTNPFGSLTLQKNSVGYLAPKAGFQIELDTSQTNYYFDFKDSQTKLREKDFVSKLDLAYALNPSVFFGMSLSYRDSKTVPTYEGMENPPSLEFTTKGDSEPSFTVGTRQDWDSYAGVFSLGFGLYSRDAYSHYQNTGTTSGNLEGGAFFAPRVSIFANQVGEPLWGFSSYYLIQQERTQAISGGPSGGVQFRNIYQGGNQFVFSTFFESPHENMNVGANLDYLRTEGARVTSYDSVGESKYSQSATSFLTMTLSSKIRLGSRLALVPHMILGRAIEYSSADRKDLMGGGVKIKASF